MNTESSLDVCMHGFIQTP